MLIFTWRDYLHLKRHMLSIITFVSLLQKAVFVYLPKWSYHRLLCLASLGSHIGKVLRYFLFIYKNLIFQVKLGSLGIWLSQGSALLYRRNKPCSDFTSLHTSGWWDTCSSCVQSHSRPQMSVVVLELLWTDLAVLFSWEWKLYRPRQTHPLLETQTSNQKPPSASWMSLDSSLHVLWYGPSTAKYLQEQYFFTCTYSL